ncbi:hypothetical protein DdX_12675 [Ditylenchus destructor]|uniref:Uncharacterized protein n=1 Tax=Ditylenchus destructor TaxID=166010 RepID=A0AAD4N035_9BILA|nr:hypothetical protein DdX_12675 [Ditylenchus destructor]
MGHAVQTLWRQSHVQRAGWTLGQLFSHILSRNAEHSGDGISKKESQERNLDSPKSSQALPQTTFRLRGGPMAEHYSLLDGVFRYSVTRRNLDKN